MTKEEGASVRKTVTVEASPERAFQVFTDRIDTWWPPTHHIGKSPLKETVLEPRLGGRCYGLQEDGAECDWGSVIAWEPPHRVVIAWQITHQWGYEPDLAKASEVDVRFTAVGEGMTRVDLEHKYFERMGPDGGAMQSAVGSPGGWSRILELFSAQANETGPHAQAGKIPSR